MKNKKIYGFVLLALIIMLLPIGMVSAKYKQTKDVGTVTLDIAPPILSPTWHSELSQYGTINKLIVDSFKNESDQKKYSFLNWDEGVDVGYDPNNGNDFKNNVRLFVNNDTAYILAIGNNPVTFPQDSSYLFHDGWNHLYNIQEIEFNSVVTSNTENMSWMFFGCASLTSLNISSFNTSKVTDMNGMFVACSSMTSLEFGDNFDTSKVINMSSMFDSCSALESLNVSCFDTSQVTNMNKMFNACKRLRTLDLSNFNTSKVINMSTMFNNCEELTSLDLGGFNTENVTNMSSLFGSCISLPNLDLSSFDTAKVADMSNMFYNCKTLVSLDLGGFNTEKVTNMNTMFRSCSNLTTIYVSNHWNVNNVNDSDFMFSGCDRIVGGNGTNYNRSHIGKDYDRIDTQDTPGYLTSITEKPSTTSNIFSLVQEGGTIIGTQITNSEEE